MQESATRVTGKRMMDVVNALAVAVVALTASAHAQGSFSKPHFHDQERYAYVVSGTWWVSTSNVYDEKTT